MATEQGVRAYSYAAGQIWEAMRGLVDAYRADYQAHWHEMPPWAELTERQQAVFIVRMRPAFAALVDAISAAIA